ncbi:hypothetical protein [Sphingomonas lenta]|uniref:Uncharacterized protein n=1 Tax=Sphingomonas lenta TaxID=1141887 RepID=A0A2A2SFZ0_9SPHN|nr:hypothetical protein [Sphingomonas lenta]PAX08169.1 hypothetical protein CKY28_11370 [Sphingomonas lenta]
MTERERPYLVCYDYGTGGLWWWITARSPDEITRTYRDVTVLDPPPLWWNGEQDRLATHLRVGETRPGLDLLKVD